MFSSKFILGNYYDSFLQFVFSFTECIMNVSGENTRRVFLSVRLFVFLADTSQSITKTIVPPHRGITLVIYRDGHANSVVNGLIDTFMMLKKWNMAFKNIPIQSLTTLYA